MKTFFQNLYYILRYSSFSNLDTKSFRKINFKNFPNTKLFGKRFPNGLVFGKRFPNSLVFGKFLKLIFLNSNLNLPPFIYKNSKIDMDAIWWPFLTINWNLNLEKIWKKKKKKKWICRGSNSRQGKNSYLLPDALPLCHGAYTSEASKNLGYKVTIVLHIVM